MEDKKEKEKESKSKKEKKSKKKDKEKGAQSEEISTGKNDDSNQSEKDIDKRLDNIIETLLSDKT